MQLTNKIKKNLSDKWQHLKSNKLFVACSGGVDSISILYYLYQLGFNITALHVNYQLRGKDSDEDEAFVKTFCKKYNIPFHSIKVDLKTQLEKGGNLQDLARKIRYKFFEDWKNKSKDNYIVLGHHLDDQVETFFLNISRKSGIMGLASMLEENIRYIRPLLSFTKEEIIELAKKEGLEWREDTSNATNKYTRNKLRNLFIPKMEEQFPNLKSSIHTLISVFQEEQFKLEKKIKPIVQQIKKNNKIEISTFLHLSEFEQVELLRQLEVPHSLLNEIKKLSKSEKGKKIELNNHRLYERIYKDVNFFSLQLKSKLEIKPTLLIKKIRKELVPINFTKEILYVDSKKIKGQISIRKWKIGDRIKPIGMKGSQLISDILKDQKVLATEKESQLIITDEEKIIWCYPHKVSREIVIDNQTVEVLKISLKAPSD